MTEPEPLTMRVGDSHAVELVGLGTSGYRWDHRLDGDPSVVETAWTRGRSPAGGAVLPIGQSSPEVLTIRAVRAGRATLHLEQRRPWERDKPPLRAKAIAVEVLPADGG